MILNLVRDVQFDTLPSYSIANYEESRKMDISYFELKELQKTMGKHAVDGQAQLSSEFVNEYGSDLEFSKRLRTMLVKDTNLINAFTTGELRKWILNQAGVVTIKMVSEILLHFAYIQELGPMLVQKGLLKLILELQSSLLN